MLKFVDSTYTIKDSTNVIDGYFSFKGKVDFSGQAWINLKPSSGVSWLYLENNTITIKGNYKSKDEGEDIFRSYRLNHHKRFKKSKATGSTKIILILV
ncbi:DUF4369 domain-containing protein [Winogradskyella sp. UBA3174]|uniref:DUF4369 domain-containing protein n=1 Tax=Winogradskyella sp. UBA3174 TaxID=1947785 RepID=UPI0039C94DB0